ncbi:MAG TPA: protease pro-enzyme activation domain-containing protein, partial [Aquella sp.]|nr:protease pro-enzyme activation domain-containing protein [Aquella sp.]
MKIKNLGTLPDGHVITVKLIIDSKLTQDQLDTLTNVLNANNLTIGKKTDLFVDIKGTSQNFSKLFKTTINQFHNKKTNHKYFSHENKFSIPEELNF